MFGSSLASRAGAACRPTQRLRQPGARRLRVRGGGAEVAKMNRIVGDIAGLALASARHCATENFLFAVVTAVVALSVIPRAQWPPSSESSWHVRVRGAGSL